MPKLTVAPLEVLLRIRNSCESFFKENFNTNSLILAIFFALPIYINYNLILGNVAVNFPLKVLFTFILIIALYLFFQKEHKWFATGFYTGLFWFWWIGLSFRYYGMSYMVPVVVLSVALFYGFVFWIVGKVYKYISDINYIAGKLFMLAVFVFGFDYLSPFTFDWLKPEVLFVNSLFSVNKPAVFLVTAVFVFWKELKWFAFVFLALALFVPNKTAALPDLDIYVASTNIPQDMKWKSDFIPKEIENNFRIINKALSEHKDAVILPESAFPVFLNRHPELMDRLKNISNKITVITGALHYKNGKYYNSTYIFENGKVSILDKHILVPFGEYIPLPFFQKEINELFFGGASDYSTGKNFGEFKVKNYDFINAVCYEATVEDVYKLKPKYVVALSNDAWFMPSVMPSLQQMLIKIYAYKYGKTVFHSINGFKSYTIH